MQGATFQRLERICGANHENEPLFRIFLFSFFASQLLKTEIFEQMS